MRSTTQKIKQALCLHQKIRQSVTLPKKERFIKLYYCKVTNRLKSCLAIIKTKITIAHQSFNLYKSKIDWVGARYDFAIWFANVCLEGIPLNIMSFFLFGIDFNPGTVLAHGIIVIHGLDIWQRLRKDGTSSKIPHKDK